MPSREDQFREVANELTELARTAQSLQNKYSAHFQLHVGACLDKDREAILEQRQALHLTLDRMLDNQEAIQRANDRMQALANG